MYYGPSFFLLEKSSTRASFELSRIERKIILVLCSMSCFSMDRVSKHQIQPECGRCTGE